MPVGHAGKTSARHPPRRSSSRAVYATPRLTTHRAQLGPGRERRPGRWGTAQPLDGPGQREPCSGRCGLSAGGAAMPRAAAPRMRCARWWPRRSPRTGRGHRHRILSTFRALAEHSRPAQRGPHRRRPRRRGVPSFLLRKFEFGTAERSRVAGSDRQRSDDQLDGTPRAWCVSELAICGKQQDIESLGQRDVDGVVDRNGLAQLPAAGE